MCPHWQGDRPHIHNGQIANAPKHQPCAGTLSGLKLLSTIPGYFVGVGLLLTFIGLVIALSKAASGTSSDAKSMTDALRQLLNAATFKFSTSIAGLFSSIVLSMLFSGSTSLISRVASTVYAAKWKAGLSIWHPNTLPIAPRELNKSSFII